jgi:hypothetical protein
VCDVVMHVDCVCVCVGIAMSCVVFDMVGVVGLYMCFVLCL